MRRPATLIGIILLLAACGSQTATTGGGDGPADGGGSAQPGGPAIIELRSSPERPHGTISAGGETVNGELGTHCWATECVDMIGPPAPVAFVEVPADLDIEFTGDGSPETMTIGTLPKEPFSSAENAQEVPINNGRASVQLEPGRHMIEIFALWADGDAVLTFGIEVV